MDTNNLSAEEPIRRFRGAYRFLSNFYPCTLIVVHACGEWYQVPTLEHAYQALKAQTFTGFTRVCQAPTAAAAKALGRQVAIRPNWDDVKRETMLALLREKFGVDVELGNRLKATGDRLLVEGNTWGDRYWGQVHGEGENWLGRLLMQVRQELREGRL